VHQNKITFDRTVFVRRRSVIWNCSNVQFLFTLSSFMTDDGKISCNQSHVMDLNFLLLKFGWNIYHSYNLTQSTKFYHRLRCAVLTMTSKVNGKMGILTPLNLKPMRILLQKLDILIRPTS